MYINVFYLILFIQSNTKGFLIKIYKGYQSNLGVPHGYYIGHLLL